MTTYLLKRIAMLVPLMLGITLITFTVIHLAPGEPVDMQMAMNPKVGKEARERLTKFYGLDKPLHEQYFTWLGKLARLDLGRSFSSDNRPVLDKIKERLPITLSLNLVALVIEFGLAIPIGVLAAVRRDTILDKGITVVVFLGFAVPTFWLALLLMYFFGVKLNWLPISGLHTLGYESYSWFGRLWDLTKHLILPSLCCFIRFICRCFPLHAFSHAAGNRSGLHHHSPGQGAVRTGRDLEACLAQCPVATDNPVGFFHSGIDWRQRHI
jgi:peptide/nickel transport system permease protein